MFYQHHLFFCVNLKEDPNKKSCQQADAKAHFDYARQRLQTLGLWGPGKARVSSSGCLGRCATGPSLVIYPEGVWYTYHNFSDIDRIIEEHIVQGKVVDDLLMDIC